MDAYIDFKNFCSYLRSSNREAYDDFFRHRFNINFEFEKEQLLKKQETKRLFDSWSTLQTQGRGKNNRIVWGDNSLPRPLNEETFFQSEDWSRLSALYMLDGDEVKALVAKGGLLVAPVGEELETLTRVMIRYKDGNNETQFPDDRISKTFRARAIKDWTNIDLNATPCTDIIIADRYFFSQDVGELQKNVFPLLKILMKNARDLAVNIVVFAEKLMRNKENIPLELIRNEILQLSNTKPNFTFVEMADNTIHGREIITNYLTIVSSNSFGTYFKKDRDEKGVADMLSLYSVVHPDLGQILKYEDIKELQKIIDEGKSKIYGDGKSNFFTFSENSLTEIRPLRTPIIGEIIQLHRDNGDNVCWEDAVTEHERFNNTSSEDFEVTRFEILNYTLNTNSKTKSQYPYFIYVKKLE